MIKQLRPFYTEEVLAQVYDTPYDHTKWPDHIERVRHTSRLLKEMDPDSVADLSCGDGAIVKGANLTCPVTLGDYKPGFDLDGPIEETIDFISHVDVFVLSETLEHVKRPGDLLDRIRDKADRLLLTTPCGEENDANPQHYWGWDVGGIAELLFDNGWSPYNGDPTFFNPFPHYYNFQIWRCM